MLFPERSSLRRTRHRHSRRISESRAQHARARGKTAFQRFHGVITHVADAKGRALELAVPTTDHDSALCHRGNEAFRLDLGREPDRRYSWRLPAKRCDVGELLSCFVTDFGDPFLRASSHRLVPG